MEVRNLDISIDLNRTFFIIANALDCIGVDDENHGHRVGFIAYHLAKKLQWDEFECQFAFYMGLIHDCGVKEKRNLHRLLESMAPNDVEQHCVRAYKLLTQCSPLSSFASPIRYHHTPWNELEKLSLPDAEKRLAALIFLCDRIDYLRTVFEHDEFGNLEKLSRQKIINEISKYRGSLFKPEFVDEVEPILRADYVWFSLSSEHIELFSRQLPDCGINSSSFSLNDVVSIAQFLASIVDAKSEFTYLHSVKVAELAVFLSDKLGASLELQKALYLAGLTHDLGKLHTPDAILHKRGSLTSSEYLCIQRHVVDSFYFMNGIFEHSIISQWAGNHHERLDGSGYPRGLTASELDTPSRIMAIADMFQALTQQRPYREQMDLKSALTTLRMEVEKGKLDPTVFKILEENAEEAYSISTSECDMCPVSQ
ncbi:HD-GYP domain-containing protein [Vibrio viridaestus]|uniref:HD domain-containing protein n=1 Tax=Vibrio viridaestus TaxID=2487322 RepID=A0A3N9TM62_9VIBR|nr:HD domain-containing phosphohydrolase [Vibrio viridaestus]RQW64933.1 HD domain-containing protein [Vibrio viridaestus]